MTNEESSFDSDEAPELRKLLDSMHSGEVSQYESLTAKPASDAATETPDKEAESKEAHASEASPVEAREESHQTAPSEATSAQSTHEEEELKTQETPAESPKENQSEAPEGIPSIEKLVDEQIRRSSLQIEEPLEVEPTYVTVTPEQAALFGPLPVELQFTLGSLEKSLSEVSELLPGQVIPLGKSLEQPVELKANGRHFAYGRLVLVEDQLAVEVVKTLEQSE